MMDFDLVLREHLSSYFVQISDLREEAPIHSEGLREPSHAFVCFTFFNLAHL